MSTNFEKVREFHKLFGLKISNTTSKDMFEDKKTLKLRLDLLKEELKKKQTVREMLILKI